MKDNTQQVLPRARKDGLVVKELPDELLIYDLDRHKAHCLNRASALVWKHCDGEFNVQKMTRVLEKQLGTSVGEDVVWLALGQLEKFHLLEKQTKPFGMFKVSRRALMTKYIPAALALPLILTVSSPTAAQAGGSCVPPGGGCTANAQCCGPGGVPGTGFCVGGGVCQTNPP